MAWPDGVQIQGLFEGKYMSYAVIIVVVLCVIKFALNEISPRTGRGKQSTVDATALYPYGVSEMQGKRPYMEDRHTVVGTLNGDPWSTFYGVFDGHGGDGASEYCVASLCSNITADPAFAHDPKLALSRGFVKTDKDYIQLADRYNKDDGTTAIGVLVRGDAIYAANVGDSRAVLIKKNGDAVPLSSDHKPNRPDERERVNSMGGHVIFWGVWRVEGILAVSRAIGDRMLKPYVIAEPEIVETTRSDEDQCIVLASDGVWDVLSNSDVARLVLQSETPQLAAKTIMEYSFQRGSQDNICALVVDLSRGTNTGAKSMRDNVSPRSDEPTSSAPPSTASRGLAAVSNDDHDDLNTTDVDRDVPSVELD
ncbi:hypothetical protein H310_12544 [Aphanomyces invadans]|uniref:PPM-type phosphatase domain-containing protein n=1 Tax=Aphanomyces invadans TaxID=157072 RepID=A0A024TH63_9STRA|nr:hypothetical protein H310_12544 [Aphanomyces invadans]ETV93500.1 hypothetical protein H310_12544 [Aphanomyces invadans]|eukprot:XP_008877842.1 hypothetical protein H310_12544 [Aphanomyces invadans]